MKRNVGVGVGLRSQHYPHLLSERARVGWFEAITENFLPSRGRPRWILDQVRKDYPLALHGVSLSIGSDSEPDSDYLKQLKAFVAETEPFLLTDHLCWTGQGGHNTHDLLPLPYNEESLARVLRNLGIVQDFLGRKILLENPSTYVAFKSSTMKEEDFLMQVVRGSGCGLLLDVNNVYVNAHNHSFDAQAYISKLHPAAVGQIHVAGHTPRDDFLFDTHVGPTPAGVWELYRHTLRHCGPVPTLIEWDTDVPPFHELESECRIAEGIARLVL